jgi:lipid II:glycine glycyltransferase (peptidoglycan interpeptide bridge formation enzyme)
LNRARSIISAGLGDGSGNLKMLYSEDGEPISGAYILSDKGTNIYLFGANDTNYRNSYGSTRIILDSLKETFQQSKKIFDFCGMNSPLRGEFKSSFNARITPYFELDLNVRREV